MAFNPDAVTTGPGTLWVAPLGTTEPTTATGALDPAFRQVGYTEEGSNFTYEFSSEGVFVAEELDPIRYDTTTRAGTVKFAMAEATRNNLALALNLGASAVNDTTVIEPPEPGNELRVVLVLDTYDNSRWLWRKCLQTGSMDIPFKKAPNKKLISVEFKLEVPTGGLKPFRVFPAANGIL
jgi:hypothetical protein